MTVESASYRLLSLVATGALAAGLGACGSEDRSGLLPGDSAQLLGERLDRVQARVGAAQCGALTEDLSGLRSSLASLPSTVDARLRARLAEGIDNLEAIAPPACQEAELGATEAPPEDTEPEPETTTTAIPTTTTPVEPPTTTPIDPTVTTPPTATGETPPGTGGTPADPDPGAVDPGAPGTGDEG